MLLVMLLCIVKFTVFGAFSEVGFSFFFKLSIFRYSKALSEHVKNFHPFAVLDTIHVRSLSLAQKKVGMNFPELYKDTYECESFHVSIPGVNVCFLQAFTRERQMSKISMSTISSTDSDLTDHLNQNFHPNPTLSLLAVRFKNFSGTMNVERQKNALLAKYMHEKHDEEDNVTSNQTLLPPSFLCEKDGVEDVGNKMVGNFNLAKIQMQFSRLCNKSDVENSYTTAISQSCSKVDFVYSSSNIVQFSKNLDLKLLTKKDIVNFVMLESGIDNISLKFGSCVKLKTYRNLENASSMKKAGHNRSQSAPAQLLSKLAQNDVTNKSASHQPTLHENQKEQMLESVIVEKQPGLSVSPRAVSVSAFNVPISCHKDSCSSITSSLSARSDSTGRLTDNESEGEDDVSDQPLLMRHSEDIVRIGKPLVSSIVAEDQTTQGSVCMLHHENDMVVNFQYIWFNCASPSSVKPVPENYHLHNNLLTTGIPAVSGWMPGVENLRKNLQVLSESHRRRFLMVASCIMALGLPEKNKMLGTVG